MKKINDEVFGELVYENSFWRRFYSITIFSREITTQLIVDSYNDADDGSDINDNQRNAFINFESDQSRIITEIERSVLEYYQRMAQNKKILFNNILEFIELKNLKFDYTDVGEERMMGFIFDASFDPELGIGILVLNEKVAEVGAQDIVL